MDFIEARTTLERLVAKVGILIKEGNVDLAAIEVLLTSIDLTLQDIKNELDLKMQRIQNSTNYRKTITTYADPVNGNPWSNYPLVITHQATTYLGVETITETITYKSLPTLGTDFRIDNIQYSL